MINLGWDYVIELCREVTLLWNVCKYCLLKLGEMVGHRFLKLIKRVGRIISARAWGGIEDGDCIGCVEEGSHYEMVVHKGFWVKLGEGLVTEHFK